MAENSKKKLAKGALKAIQELDETIKLENIIKDNKIVFKSGKDTFRVRTPNLAEQQEIGEQRRVKYTELVNDDSYLFKKQWIEKYKKKGIDIKKMEDDILRIQDEVKKVLLRLAQTTDEKTLQDFKGQIIKLRDEQYILTMEKADLLSYSIEDQLMVFGNSYATYLILEKKEGDKWIKYFSTYREFTDSENLDIVNKAFYYTNNLFFGVDENE